MENKYHSGAKTKAKPLIIHLQGDLTDINIKYVQERLTAPLELSSIAESSHVLIKSFEDSFHVDFKFSQQKNTLVLKKNTNNLFNILEHASSLINKKNKIPKLIIRREHRIDKIFNSKIKKVQKWQKRKSDLINLSTIATTIQNFPFNLLSLDAFDHYLSSHVIIHSKGNSFAEGYNYNKNYGFKKKTIETKDFIDIFKVIKKSKNKSFTNLKLKKLNLELVGSFLGKEIELPKHNIIIIISRNDFLSPTKDEIAFFNSFTKLMPKFLNHLIESEHLNKEMLFISELLNHLPVPIRVIDSKGKLQFSNFNEKDESFSMILETTTQLDNNTIELFKIKDEEITSTDLFHHQRLMLLGELLNTLRHELSNPLFGLNLATNLLSRDNLCEDSLEMLDEVTNSISRCQLIMEDFSNLYQTKPISKRTSIKKLINETLTLTKSETRGLNKYIEYQSIEDEDKIFLNINPTWLVQILFNLIINSVQALKNSDISNIETFFKITVRKNQNRLFIDVTDNGPGLLNIETSKIFSPFETTKKQGTGLGLSISKNLAKKMNGNLSFSENYDKNNARINGVTFTIELPYEKNSYN
jgi:two-component system NtrC family sensor kinase